MSERPLLASTNHSPENLTIHPEQPKKFRDVDNLTDSDEMEMDVSNSENDSRPAKRQRYAKEADLGDTPRWSNPDPYTSLPPMDSAERKRKDMVKIIRKARNTSLSTDEMAPLQNDQDFISFGAINDEVEQNSEAPSNAPSGPKGERTDEPVLGKRKRETINQKRAQAGRLDGSISRVWETKDEGSSIPWLSRSSRRRSVGVA